MKHKGKYLDPDGNPVDENSPEGHIVTGEKYLPQVIIMMSKSAIKQYNKDMKQYEKDLKKYEKDMIKYRKDLEKYYKKCNCLS